jgi:outer membrane protein OmpA-like peptidoglycan-associated protein
MKPAAAHHIALAIAALVLSAAAVTSPASAEDPSTNQIVKSLQPKVKFRSFDPNQAAKDAKQADLVGRLQKAKTRQITVEERAEIVEVVKDNELPAIDLEVFFAFDSADITPEALPTLKKLGQALSDEKLKGSVFLVAGHTDAKGSAAYNLGLSDARAKSVQSFLIEQFHMDPKQLVATGFGEEQLKNKDDPLAGENRRVQVVNMASKDVAAKADAPADVVPEPQGAPAKDPE